MCGSGGAIYGDSAGAYILCRAVPGGEVDSEGATIDDLCLRPPERSCGMYLKGEANRCIRLLRHLHQQLRECRRLADEKPVGNE